MYIDQTARPYHVIVIQNLKYEVTVADLNKQIREFKVASSPT